MRNDRKNWPLLHRVLQSRAIDVVTGVFFGVALWSVVTAFMPTLCK